MAFILTNKGAKKLIGIIILIQLLIIIDFVIKLYFYLVLLLRTYKRTYQFVSSGYFILR